jgi:hypothetical protein
VPIADVTKLQFIDHQISSDELHLIKFTLQIYSENQDNYQ